jgi:hypothetical protein
MTILNVGTENSGPKHSEIGVTCGTTKRMVESSNILSHGHGGGIYRAIGVGGLKYVHTSGYLLHSENILYNRVIT